MGVADAGLDRRHKEVLCLVGNLFVGRNVEEDENCPKADSLVKVLGLNLVRENGARSDLRSSKQQGEESRLFDFLDVGLSKDVVSFLREGSEGIHNICLI